ncbi:MAG: hypothetical protein M1812_006856 [Candelaria pacifica]|nr:MAG: hypothetical protein M1812_006856 [Candelaria pacifica]
MSNNISTNKRKRKMPPGAPIRKQSVAEGKRKAPPDSSDTEYDFHSSHSGDEAPSPERVSLRQAKRFRCSDTSSSGETSSSRVDLSVRTPDLRDNREFAVLERIRELLPGSGRGVYLGDWMVVSAPFNPFDPDDKRLKQVNFPCDEITYRANLLRGMIDYIVDKDNDIADANKLLRDLQEGTADVRDINYPLPSHTGNWRGPEESQAYLQELMQSASGREQVNVLQSYQLAEQWILRVRIHQKDITAKLLDLWPEDVPFFKPLSEEGKAIRRAKEELETERKRLEALMVRDEPAEETSPEEIATKVRKLSISVVNPERGETLAEATGRNSGTDQPEVSDEEEEL